MSALQDEEEETEDEDEDEEEEVEVMGTVEWRDQADRNRRRQTGFVPKLAKANTLDEKEGPPSYGSIGSEGSDEDEGINFSKSIGNNESIGLDKRRYIEAKLGQLRCYDALGEYETLLTEALDLWQKVAHVNVVVKPVRSFTTPTPSETSLATPTASTSYNNPCR